MTVVEIGDQTEEEEQAHTGLGVVQRVGAATLCVACSSGDLNRVPLWALVRRKSRRPVSPPPLEGKSAMDMKPKFWLEDWGWDEWRGAAAGAEIWAGSRGVS